MDENLLKNKLAVVGGRVNNEIIRMIPATFIFRTIVKATRQRRR